MRTPAIDQDAILINEEVYGEVFETEVLKALLAERGSRLWVRNKSDPE